MAIRNLASVFAILVFPAASVCAQTGVAAQAQQTRCSSIQSLAIPGAKVNSAREFAAGAFNGPVQQYSGVDQSGFYKKLPAFCQVMLTATPTSDSEIAVEVWLPLTGWNGRLQGIGNGGFAGMIDEFELGAAMARGYAAVATDTGHKGSPIEAGWAVGHPEKIADFGHRGVHEMTRVAKLVAAEYYSKPPAHSYFAGCSDGGREALMEAQRYPEDYDGILAGAPANYWTALVTMGVTDTLALTATPGSYIPASKIPAIAKAVVAACDALDGVRDGILNDPRQCHFDSASIACKPGEDKDDCLTTAQRATLNAIYGGVKDSAGHSIFPGYLPGAEGGPGGWGLWVTGPAPGRSLMAAFGGGFYSNMVYGDPKWQMGSFTMDSSYKLAVQKTAGWLNATDANLEPFRSRGGKLILYHGWNDPAIPSKNTVNYYQQVLDKAGQQKADSFVRLYMVPGMQHCSGGPGTDVFGQSGTWDPDAARNARTALEDWVEKGAVPSVIVATKTAEGANGVPEGPPTMTRPLCPFPLEAHYKGTGDSNRAENFTCSSPGKQ